MEGQDMNYWIGYAKSGREVEVEADLLAMGIHAEVARKVEAIRRGKRRFPDAVVSAMFPNVIAITGTDQDWHRMQSVRYLARTTIQMCKRTYETDLRPCFDKVASDTAKRLAGIEAGQRVEEYQTGDEIKIMSGNLAGQIAIFRRIVECPHEPFPIIEADWEGFGRTSKIRLDPINARRN